MRKSTMLSKVRFGVLSICAVATVAFALSPTQARADEINLEGYTAGYFNNSPGTTSLNSGNLVFQGVGLFNSTTLGGSAALNLGSFTLFPAPLNTIYSYTGTPFTIDINFTLPALSNQASTAKLQGSVSSSSTTGGVWVLNFSQPDLTIDFTNSSGNPDSFDLALSTVAIAPTGTPVELTGFVTYTGTGSGSSSVPEPPTMVLAGLGIAGVFLLKRRLLLA